MGRGPAGGAIRSALLKDPKVLKEMKNADGTVDSWHEQKILYGMAVADIFLACPVNIIGIVLVFVNFRWGAYLLTWSTWICQPQTIRLSKPITASKTYKTICEPCDNASTRISLINHHSTRAPRISRTSPAVSGRS